MDICILHGLLNLGVFGMWKVNTAVYKEGSFQSQNSAIVSGVLRSETMLFNIPLFPHALITRNTQIRTNNKMFADTEKPGPSISAVAPQNTLTNCQED